jgi:hypothetical protein
MASAEKFSPLCEWQNMSNALMKGNRPKMDSRKNVLRPR